MKKFMMLFVRMALMLILKLTDALIMELELTSLIVL